MYPLRSAYPFQVHWVTKEQLVEKNSDVYAHLLHTTIESKSLGVQRMQTRTQEPKKPGPILIIETNPPIIFINAMGSPREDHYLLITAT